MYKPTLLMTVIIGLLALQPRANNKQINSSDTSTPSQTKLVTLATLEWPPYSSKSMPNDGEIVAKVVEVFSLMGYETKIEFLPWSRAVRNTYGEQPLYLGYFPEYPVTDAHFLLSASLGESIVGFAQLKDRSLQISDAQSLTRYRLGIVQDYVNTMEVDSLIAEGKIKPIVAIDDRQNLVRVLNGDVDAAVIDKNVMQFLLENDLPLKEHGAGKIEFNNTLSQTISLHIAFSRYHPDANLYEKFNNVLLQLNAKTVED